MAKKKQYLVPNDTEINPQLKKLVEKVEPVMNDFIILINQLKCPHEKDLYKIIEAFLAINEQGVNYIINQDKALKASINEIGLVLTSEQNGKLSDILEKFKKIFSAHSNAEGRKTRIEMLISRRLLVLVSKFKETIQEPLVFHEFKISWLNESISAIKNHFIAEAEKRGKMQTT